MGMYRKDGQNYPGLPKMQGPVAIDDLLTV